MKKIQEALIAATNSHQTLERSIVIMHEAWPRSAPVWLVKLAEEAEFYKARQRLRQIRLRQRIYRLAIDAFVRARSICEKVDASAITDCRHDIFILAAWLLRAEAKERSRKAPVKSTLLPNSELSKLVEPSTLWSTAKRLEQRATLYRQETMIGSDEEAAELMSNFVRAIPEELHPTEALALLRTWALCEQELVVASKERKK